MQKKEYYDDPWLMQSIVQAFYACMYVCMEVLRMYETVIKRLVLLYRRFYGWVGLFAVVWNESENLQTCAIALLTEQRDEVLAYYVVTCEGIVLGLGRAQCTGRIYRRLSADC